MLSAVVFAADAGVPVSATPEAMARTLAALVPAVVEGLLRDVTLATLVDTAQAGWIADHLGCGLAEAGAPEGVLSAGIAATRGELILLLRAGYAPEAGFTAEFADIFDRAEAVAPRAAIVRTQPETLAERLFPALANVQALILRRDDIGKPATSLAALRRGLVAPVTFRCRLRRLA